MQLGSIWHPVGGVELVAAGIVLLSDCGNR